MEKERVDVLDNRVDRSVHLTGSDYLLMEHTMVSEEILYRALELFIRLVVEPHLLERVTTLLREVSKLELPSAANPLVRDNEHIELGEVKQFLTRILEARDQIQV